MRIDKGAEGSMGTWNKETEESIHLCTFERTQSYPLSFTHCYSQPASQPAQRHSDISNPSLNEKTPHLS